MKQLNFKDISKIMSCPKPTKPPTDCLYQTAVSDSDSQMGLANQSSKSIQIISGLSHLKVKKKKKKVRPQGSMFTRNIFWERQNEIKPWHSILFLSPKSSPSHDHFYCYRNAPQKEMQLIKAEWKTGLLHKRTFGLWEIRHTTEKPSSYISQLLSLKIPGTTDTVMSVPLLFFLILLFVVLLTLPSATKWMAQK